MSMKLELIGKTISGVVAAREDGEGAGRIWMLQFTDGTHVEFVSPVAKRRLERLASAPQLPLGHMIRKDHLSLNAA